MSTLSHHQQLTQAPLSGVGIGDHRGNNLRRRMLVDHAGANHDRRQQAASTAR